MAEAGAIVSTTLLKVLIFSGDKETKEYDGRKHIGAADLLTEMARRKAANPAWNKEAAIRHCVRSFKNNVAAPKKPGNHISRDTFTNVTESEKRGEHGKGTGKHILGGTCLKDGTKKCKKQTHKTKEEANVAGSSVAQFTIIS
jgi:hypothetical protein